VTKNPQPLVWVTKYSDQKDLVPKLIYMMAPAEEMLRMYPNRWWCITVNIIIAVDNDELVMVSDFFTENERHRFIKHVIEVLFVYTTSQTNTEDRLMPFILCKEVTDHNQIIITDGDDNIYRNISSTIWIHSWHFLCRCHLINQFWDKQVVRFFKRDDVLENTGMSWWNNFDKIVYVKPYLLLP